MSRDGRREALMATGACFAADPEDLGLDVLAAMVRASSDGLIVLDRDLRYVYANPAACTLLGQELDELLGCDDLSGPQLCQRFQRDRLVAVLGGKPERWEAVLHRPDGSELDIVCTATRLEFRSRELLVVGLRDVSERRRRARKAAALARQPPASRSAIPSRPRSRPWPRAL